MRRGFTRAACAAALSIVLGCEGPPPDVALRLRHADGRDFEACEVRVPSHEVGGLERQA